jgi:5-methylcytosine-specific restriction endonuclease McrA
MSNKKVLTQEMLEDLSRMGDVEFCKKWNCSRNIPIKRRKELGIESFNKQHGTIPHKFFENEAYKWCPSGGGHWENIKLYNKSSTRYDGLCGLCRTHTIENGKIYYVKNNRKEEAQRWRKTDGGKKSLRRTWRRSKAIKDDAYVLWEREHEERAYDVFDGACAYCGVKVPFLKIEFDHFVPIKNGGKTEPCNMLPCCTKCNHGVNGKFTRDAWEWLSDRFGTERASYIYNNCRQKLGLNY